MSTIKLKHSGGNSVSLNPPTSAPTSSEVAFKLPNADGSANQLLKTDGSGNLGWATDQGGKILQMQQTHITSVTTTTMSTENDTYDITDFFVNITSTAANSKFLISALVSGEASTADHDIFFILRREISGSTTDIATGPGSGSRRAVTRQMNQGHDPENNRDSTPSSSSIPPFLDSPNQSAGTTIKYKVGAVCTLAGSVNFYLSRSHNDGNARWHERMASYILVQEVAA